MNSNEQTTVINGWDIKTLSLAYDLLKTNDPYITKVQRKSALTRHGSKFKAKTNDAGNSKRFVPVIKRLQYLFKMFKNV